MPSPSSIPPDDLLDRYFTGDLNDERAREVREYLENDPRRRGVIRGILDAARGDDIASRPAANDAYDRFIGRLDKLTRNTTLAVPSTPTGVFRGLRLHVAAVATFGILAAVLATTLWNRMTNESTVLSYVTSGGAQATVSLADGSRLTLAPYSRVTMARTRETTRHLTLSGEAYFDVISSATNPLIVQTGNVTTRVLGTAFSVRHYNNEPDVRVVVVDGKVESENSSSKVVLTAGNIAHITDSTTMTREGDAHAYTSWTEGRLIFSDIEVRHMLLEVGRWYGYEFKLSDSVLSSHHVTTTLILKDRAETLRAIEELLEVTMTFDGPVVTLHTTRTSRERSLPKTRESKAVWDALSPHKESGR